MNLLLRFQLYYLPSAFFRTHITKKYKIHLFFCIKEINQLLWMRCIINKNSSHVYIFTILEEVFLWKRK